MSWVDFDETLDEEYDVIIRRNTWVEDENKTQDYYKKNELLKQRLSKKKIKTVIKYKFSLLWTWQCVIYDTKITHNKRKKAMTKTDAYHPFTESRGR